MHHRKFISLVVSAAVTITSIFSTAAQAETRYVYPQQRQSQGNEAVAAALAGIAALFIIGKTLEQQNDRREKAAPAPAPKVTHKRKGHGHKSNRGHNRHHKPKHYAHGHGGHKGHGGHAHWHRHGNMKHIHGHGRKHHRARH